MSTGTSRQYVMVLNPVAPDDTEGGQAVTWAATSLKLWLDLRSLSAREQAIAGALQSIVTLRGETTYYEPRITDAKRFRRIDPPGLDLQILGVRDPDGRRRKLELDCAEVV